MSEHVPIGELVALSLPKEFNDKHGAQAILEKAGAVLLEQCLRYSYLMTQADYKTLPFGLLKAIKKETSALKVTEFSHKQRSFSVNERDKVVVDKFIADEAYSFLLSLVCGLEEVSGDIVGTSDSKRNARRLWGNYVRRHGKKSEYVQRIGAYFEQLWKDERLVRRDYMPEQFPSSFDAVAVEMAGMRNNESVLIVAEAPNKFSGKKKEKKDAFTRNQVAVKALAKPTSPYCPRIFITHEDTSLLKEIEQEIKVLEVNKQIRCEEKICYLHFDDAKRVLADFDHVMILPLPPSDHNEEREPNARLHDELRSRVRDDQSVIVLEHPRNLETTTGKWRKRAHTVFYEAVAEYRQKKRPEGFMKTIRVCVTLGRQCETRMEHVQEQETAARGQKEWVSKEEFLASKKPKRGGRAE